MTHPTRRVPFFAFFAFFAASAGSSCRPDFGERESLVDRPRVLAVLVDPPEARPGEPITTRIVVATSDGAAPLPAASWAFCATPKLLTENGSVSASCLAEGVTPIAVTRGGITAPLPATGCFDFGPETQSAEVRPRDADVTGGYFVPIRARVEVPADEPLTAFGFARIACNLGSAPADLTKRFAAEYVRNDNPRLLPIEGRLESGASVDFTAVPRGARVALRAAWPASDAQTYALFDVRAQQIVLGRESMRVSWFTTAGSFERDRTGRTDTEIESFTDNTWTAPDAARPVQLWAVLRDARGGVAIATVTLTVTATAQ